MNTNDLQILTGDSLKILPRLKAEYVQCCVTSPPYWGLRDYKHLEQIGDEQSPESYVENLVAIFREVRRILKKEGTVWLSIGDGYASNCKVPDCWGLKKAIQASTRLAALAQPGWWPMSWSARPF